MTDHLDARDRGIPAHSPTQTPSGMSSLSSHGPARTPPASPRSTGTGPPKRGRDGGGPRTGKTPTDVAFVFMMLAAALVLFPLLSRKKLDHSPNDAARWNTVFFLVEYGTYAYNNDWEVNRTLPWNGGKGRTEQELADLGIDKSDTIRVGDLYYTVSDGRFYAQGPFWSIDMVRLGNKYYSSKTPFLPTCVAGAVWLIYKASAWILPDGGWTFVDHPWAIMRTTVILVQLVPFLIMVWVSALWVRRQSESPFVRNFCIAAAALGTYLTPYLLPLNNHVIAACTALFAMYAAARILYGEKPSWVWFGLAGFFAAFTAAVETPAAVFAVVLYLVLMVRSPLRTMTIGLLAALIPLAAAVYTNFLVTGSLKDAIIPMPMRFNEVDGPYVYDGSYWKPNDYNKNGPTGMDALEEPKDLYLANMLVGHHGFFLLTPILLVSLLGIGRHLPGQTRVGAVMMTALLALATAVLAMLPRALPEALPQRLLEPLMGWGWFVPLGLLFVMNLGMYASRPEKPRPLLGCLVLIVSVVVIGLLVWRTHNYGGTCQGFRRLFWLIPLWLMMLPAGVEMLSRSWLGRVVCYALFAVSLLSMGWAMPQVEDGAEQRPFTTSWAHELFRNRDLPLGPLRIQY